MRTLGTLLLCSMLWIGLTAQQSANMVLLGQWDDNTLPIASGVQYNDIWGYAVAGREFAIVGSREKIHFLEITDPDNIVEVAAIAGGGNSTWRDIKTYGTYAYAVADQHTTSEGLMIMDISNITGTDPMAPRVTLLGQERSHFTRAHNIYIDTDNGVLYAVGVNVGATSMVIYDLTVDPANPSLIGSILLNGDYIHDLFVENHIAYCSHENRGLYIYDMSPLTAPLGPPGVPVELAVIDGYGYEGYNHSSWVSGNTIVFADETHGSPLTIADISDLDDVQIQGYFHSNLLNVPAPYNRNPPRGPIPHNPFILGNLCIASYYHDGISVFDISDPANVVQVGYYDTDLASTNYDGYNGCWGVYPFLPSGRIIGSDVLNGLFVLEYNTALPVEWATFTAQEDADRVRLDWSTTKEENNAGFIVQRAEGKDWIDLAQVLPEAKQIYRSYDHAPQAGWNTYRIVQEDYDGSRSYSRLATVFWGEEMADWSVYPNPARSGASLTIQNTLDADGLWQLHNTQGQTVFRMQASVSATGGISLALPDLPKGVYWLEEAATGTVQALVVE